VPSRSLPRPINAVAATPFLGDELNFAAAGALKNDAIRRVANQSRAAGAASRIALPKCKWGACVLAVSAKRLLLQISTATVVGLESKRTASAAVIAEQPRCGRARHLQL
jgi:hypothetical protein